ncbi:MAG: type I-MYXAN CRISPR-associated protein Cas6/Cmx6 [Gammaproteobacteria bacterium]|nr:type I-MYXAN CRISPR-associated protein Cas6/Cmx6 [Gammaproteobacteria bacterium]MDD9886932.1 type I-MYXAN CRISPR-associated protein Cas6/Cmx6 [Gammaproteobacteria bacterium]
MNLHWQEESAADAAPRVPDDIADLNFRITCRLLPADHAWALYRALSQALPWLDDEPRAAVHSIHGAESGNGWERPQRGSDEIHLSRRARLCLRLPRERFADARALQGARLDVSGYEVRVGAANVRPLSSETTLFSRHLPAPAAGGENAFLEQAAAQLAGAGVSASRMMGGRGHVIRTPDREIAVCSLMVSGLAFGDAVRLQQRGLGGEQKLGCGIFLPHKGIEAVA